MTNCWNKILNALSAKVDDFDFKVWLAPIVAQTGERSLTLCLQGASSYMLHRLEKKMGGLIRQAAAQIFDCRPDEVVMNIGGAAMLPGLTDARSANATRDVRAAGSAPVPGTREQGVQAKPAGQASQAKAQPQAQDKPSTKEQHQQTAATRTSVRVGAAPARIARAQGARSVAQTRQTAQGQIGTQSGTKTAAKPFTATDRIAQGTPGHGEPQHACQEKATENRAQARQVEAGAKGEGQTTRSQTEAGVAQKAAPAASKTAASTATQTPRVTAMAEPSLPLTAPAMAACAAPAAGRARAASAGMASSQASTQASMSPFVAASMQAQAFASPVSAVPMGAMVTDNGVKASAMQAMGAMAGSLTGTMGAMGGSIPGSMTGSMPSITTVGADGSRSTYTMAAQPLVRNLPLDQAATLSGDALNRKQWRYTFADFVVGPTNAMALTAAQDVCRPKSFVETLFVSSEPGLGKTHIVQSAVRQILEDRGPTARVAYLTAEDFYARFRMGLRNDSLDDFTSRVRALDFLLIDDVQFLFGKHKTQELLMSLVKQLQGKGSKVVITSRFMSKDLTKDLDSQLVSLIASGVQASMDAPDYAMRCEIVRRKAASHGISLDEEVVALLATHLEGDVRRIESCLQTLFLRMKVMGVGASPDLALEVLSKFGCSQDKQDGPLPTFEDFMGCVSQCYGLTESQICSCIRRRNFVEARNVLFYLARKHTSMTLAQIGAKVNKRHSTVIKGIATIEHSLTSQTKSGRQTAHLVELIEKNAGCARCA